MLSRHADWAERPCWYVVARTLGRMARLAGPYRSAAEAALPRAVRRAMSESGDPRAGEYGYRVHQDQCGHASGILGAAAP